MRKVSSHHVLLQCQDLRLLVVRQARNLLWCQLHDLLQQCCKHRKHAISMQPTLWCIKPTPHSHSRLKEWMLYASV